MLKIALSGANGKMGKAILAAAKPDPEVTIPVKLIKSDQKINLLEELKAIDVCIDFSSPAGSENYLTGTGCVIAGNKVNCNYTVPVSKTITINLRSSWEAFFQIKNPNLFFEKLRIPYKINDVVKSYILDFVDEKNNIIYEIKPYALHDTKVNMLKFNAAKKWANENNFKFVIIDNSWFYKNYDPSILIGQPSEERIKKLLKQFFKK